MEINSLGLMNMDDFRMSAMAGAQQPQQNFIDVLQRAVQSSGRAGDEIWEGRRVTAASNVVENEKLFQLCLELETFLVKNLLTTMRSTIQRSGLIDHGFAGEIFEDMLWDERAKDFTRNAGFGLAEAAYRQLSQSMR